MANIDGLDLRLHPETLGSHFTKFHLHGLPRSAVLHRFTSAEPDSDPHDHPWGFTSFVISGGYVEEIFRPEGFSYKRARHPGSVQYVDAARIHRITYLYADECWTLVLPGPVERKSGFYRWEEKNEEKNEGQGMEGATELIRLYRPWDRAKFERIEP